MSSVDRAAAHEFWLEMIKYRPAVGESVPVVHRNGEEFAGNSYPYLRDDTQRFSIVTARGEINIKAIDGDDPAAEIQFADNGLNTVVYQGAINEIEFESFAKFESYLRAEGLEKFIQLHRLAAKPEKHIRERYFRCAKALVAVGHGHGNDQPVGLPLEIVVEQNPYHMKKGSDLPVRLLYQGKPLAGAALKLFTHQRPAQPDVKRTDKSGRAVFRLSSRGEYMLHAVHMRHPPETTNAAWESLWASLTFYRP